MTKHGHSSQLGSWLFQRNFSVLLAEPRKHICAWALSHMRAVRNPFLTFLSSVVASNLTVPLNEVYHIWQCSDVVSNGLGISLNVYRSKSGFPGRSVCEIWGNQFRIPPGLMSFGILHTATGGIGNLKPLKRTDIKKIRFKSRVELSADIKWPCLKDPDGLKTRNMASAVYQLRLTGSLILLLRRRKREMLHK